MTEALTIEKLRLELRLTQEEFAPMIGLNNKGSVSVIERGGPCSLTVALALEALSNGRLDAAALNPDVAAARRCKAIIDDRSDPGSWADAIRHSPNLRVEEHGGQPPEYRTIVCAVCERRLDGQTVRGCTAVDCPHAAESLAA